MVGATRKEDVLDRLVIFLAKRDGIDKLVKTFQYVSKLVHWRLEERDEGMAERAKKWEVACGLARKAFRTGRFLTGLNSLRSSSPSRAFQVLAVLANGGEMVYFFFDHLLWLSRVGVLDPAIARRMSFVSAFGESVGYVFFVVSDLIRIRQGLLAERRLLRFLRSDKHAADHPPSDKSNNNGAAPDSPAAIADQLRALRVQRIMLLMAIAANLADLVIAIADIEPNPFCNHALTLGISGLVSAWAGWYRNWPAS